jgi:ureidoacrylate peracid hydrolase
MKSNTNQQRRRLLAGLALAPFIESGVLAAGTSRGRRIELDAKPAPIALDAAKTAVIVVDMQNDFGSPGGMFALAGINIAGIRQAIAPTAKVLAAARRASLPIVYLKMAFRSDLSDLGAPGSPNRERHLRFRVGDVVQAPDGRSSRILIRDTWNTDILAELKPEPADILLYKHRFSGFFETNLHASLQRLGITNLVFVGCTTSVCVEATVRDAMYRDYSSVLLTDCMSQPALPGSQPGVNHDSTLVLVNTFLGWTSDSEEFSAALTKAVAT